jgi:type IV secretory pathway component VirB8
MGAAFDQACRSLRHFPHSDRVRELVAKRIIEVAKNGERDPIRLHWQAVMGFSFDEVSIPVNSVRRNLPVPVYAPIARLG